MHNEKKWSILLYISKRANIYITNFKIINIPDFFGHVMQA
jgi:hypothetical protein